MNIWDEAYAEWSRSPNDARRSGRDEALPVMDFMKMLVIQIRYLKPSKRKVLADIGCGNGLFSVPLAELYGAIMYVDSVQNQIDHAKASMLIHDSNTHPRCVDLSVEKNRDVIAHDVLVNGVLQSIPPDKLDVFFGNIKSMLSPGGQVFFQGIPHVEKMAPVIQKKLEEAVAAGHEKTAALYQAVVMYHPDTLSKMLEGMGFKCQVIEPRLHDPHHADCFHLLARLGDARF